MTDIASLGLEVESAPVERARDALGRFVSMATKAEAAVVALATRADQAGTKIASGASRAETAAAQLARQIDKSAQAMDSYNRAARANDIAAYGLELDRLRAKYNPVFAAIQRYRAAINDIRTANAAGAISSREMVAAIAQQRTASLATIVALKGQGQAVEEVIKKTERLRVTQQRQGSAFGVTSGGAQNYVTSNIAAQFQDIGVTAAMGMSPLTIALQQGTQLQAILGPMGLVGSLRALGTAFMSLLTPISLVILGAVAAVAALIQYFGTASTDAKKLKEVFKDHEDGIRDLKDAYGDAAKGAEAYTNVSRAVAKANIIINNADLKKEIDKQVDLLTNGGKLMVAATTKMYEDMSKSGLGAELQDPKTSSTRKAEIVKEMADLNAGLKSIADGALAAKGEFEPFRAEIDAFYMSVKAGHPDFIQLQKSIAEKVNTNPTVDGLVVMAKELMGFTNAGAKAQSAIKATEDSLNGLTAALDKSVEMAKDFKDAMKTMEGVAKTPQTDKEVAEAAYAKAVASSSDAIERKLALSELEATSKRIDAKVTLEQSKSYDKIIDGGQRRLVQLQAEVSTFGMSRSAIEAYRMEQDMLHRATEDGINLDSKAADGIRTKRQEIHDLAEETKKYNRVLDELNLRSDLAFEREQIGRDDTEKRVASEMRRVYGDDYAQYMDSGAAATIRVNEHLMTMQKELDGVNKSVKDTFTGLVDLLYQSGDLTDKLIGAFAELGKMFAKMGMEKIFDFATGKTDSIFGGLPEALSSGPGMNVGGSASVANYKASGTAIGQTIAPPIVGSLNKNLETYAAAIRKVESGSYAGNYQAEGQVITNPKSSYYGDRAYGAYQVMGNNIASWTKEATGASMSIQEFLGSKIAQDKVAYTKLQQSFDKFGNWADVISVHFSGRPVSKAGNASDGYNTVPEYVQKALTAANNYDPNNLKRGVSDGVIDADRKLSANQNDPWGGMRNKTTVAAQTSGGNNFGALASVGGAALGAFAGGYQSGSPIMGGINGAMSGLGAAGAIGSAFPALGAAAGPIGMIGGAIIGIIGGILGKAKQKREELKKAQQELEAQVGAITTLMRNATGNYLGAMEKQFGDTVDEFQKAITMAEKAKNSKLVIQLKEAQQKFFDKLVTDWNNSFQGTLDSLNAGLGMDGEFLKGMSAVEKMRQSLVGFVNDAKFFAESNGDLSTMLDSRKKALGIGSGKQAIIYKPKDEYSYREGGRDSETIEGTNKFEAGYKDLGLQLIEKGFQAFNDKGGQFYDTLKQLTDAATKAGFSIDELGKVTRTVNESAADSVQEAMEASQKSALATLSGGKAFSEIEQAIQRLQGAAASLPELLKDLGMSSEEAAKAIQFHLNIALRDLKNGLSSDLQSSINDLSGFGYLNDLLGAQTTYEARVKDLTALGMGTGAALQELGLRLANIAKDADLTEDQLKELAAVFPQLGSSLTSLIGASLGTSQQALDDAESKLTEAKNAARASFEKEIGLLKDAKTAQENYNKSIQKFMEDLKLDDNLSPLDPGDRFREAQKQYIETTQLALTGDTEAIGKVEDVSRQYLEEARAYYGTSEGYFSIFNEVEATLGQVLATGKTHLSELEAQLAAMEAQRDAVLGVEDAVLSVEDAIKALDAAQAARDAAKAARDAAQAAIFQQMLELLKTTGQAYNPTITGMYRDVLGRAPDAEGAAYYTQMLNSGMSVQDLMSRFVMNAQPELTRGYATPAYASGGFHPGGLAMVGERGPELVNLGAARIWNSQDTERMMRQSRNSNDNSQMNDNSELVAEFRAVVQELEGLRADRNRGDGVAVNGAQATISALRETTEVIKKQREDAWRESGRRKA